MFEYKSYLLLLISMLSSIGIIMQTRINSDNGIRQMMLYLAGVVCYFVTIIIYRIFHKYWNRLTVAYFGISILSFILTAVLGAVKNGSKNWRRKWCRKKTGKYEALSHFMHQLNSFPIAFTA